MIVNKVRILKSTKRNGDIVYEVQHGNFWKGWTNSLYSKTNGMPVRVNTIEEAREWAADSKRHMTIKTTIVT